VAEVRKCGVCRVAHVAAPCLCPKSTVLRHGKANQQASASWHDSADAETQRVDATCAEAIATQRHTTIQNVHSEQGARNVYKRQAAMRSASRSYDALVRTAAKWGNVQTRRAVYQQRILPRFVSGAQQRCAARRHTVCTRVLLQRGGG